MNTSEKAPRSLGRTSIAACSTLTSGRAASSAVSRSESVVAPIELAACPAARASSASSAVLTRLPLWPSARPVPAGVVRKLGWAFSHVVEPVVE